MMIIETSGLSMRPLLVTGDLVNVTPYQYHEGPIPFGSLIYATNINQQKIIHRYIGSNLIKGDRVKELDQILTIDGVVKSKLNVHGHEKSLNGSLQRFSLGILSYGNQRKFFLIHRLAAGMIEILGKILR